MEKNERLEIEVQGLLNAVRELERENKSLKSQSSRYESMMVCSPMPRQIEE